MEIELNFFELENQNFEIIIFLSLYHTELKYKENKRFRLDSTDNYYEVSLVERDGFEECRIPSNRNRYVTLWFLTNCLKNNKVINFSYINEFERNKGKFYINIEQYSEGDREIYIQPEYIESINKFGFLLGFHFRNKESNYSIKQQKLSFSLTMEKYPKSNIFINQNIRNFLSENFNKKIRPILVSLDRMVIPRPIVVDTGILSQCFYSNNEVELLSNFNLVKNHVKIKRSEQKNYYFIFRQSEREFALKVYNTLIGKLYNNYFSGVKNFFGFDLIDYTKNLIIFDFNEDNINKIESEILNKDKKAFLIFCMPNREASYAEEFYINCKLLCLKYNISSQFLYMNNLFDGEKLKYSASNIALQIFCKSGGIPWKVSNKKFENKSLIIGVGTCHKNNEKFYAYAVCSDSSGVFNFTMSLSFSLDKDEYFNQIQNSLITLRNKYINKGYSNVVFHLTTKMTLKDISRLQRIIKDIFSSEIGLVILKLNKSKKYVGFSQEGRNDLIIKRGTIFCIEPTKKILLWTDGCISNEKASHRPSRPLDIELLYSSYDTDMYDYLDDIYKLSNANWHGFNTTTLPISLVYSKNIANFVSLLYYYGKDIDLANLDLIHTDIPWFL